MGAVQYIQDHVNPRRILDYYNFQHIKETEKEIRSCCAIHGGDSKTAFVWNKVNNLWFCYTGDCGGGDVFNLIEKMEECSFQDAVIKAASILGLNIDGMAVDLSDDRLKNEQIKWLQKQMKKNGTYKKEEYHLPHTTYYDSEEAFQRFPLKTLQHFNAKFCKLYPTEKSVLMNKLVIPIVNSKTLLGVALRDTTGQFTPKWIYQPTGIQMKNCMYNLDKVRSMIDNEETEEIILVEGIFDVWAYHQIGIDNVVAIFGSSISDEQYKILMELNVTITCSFDADKSGRKCTDEALKIFKNKADITVVRLPDGKDPADCEPEELREAYLNRRM